MSAVKFENANQIHTYLKSEGWKVSYNTLTKHIADPTVQLSPTRKGGFTQAAVDKYARAYLVRRAAVGEEVVDEPQSVEAVPQGLAERKLERQISAMSLKERREAFTLMREMGLFVEVVTIDRELADRWQALKLFLPSWLKGEADSILALLGGDQAEAERIVQLVGGDPVKADDLMRHQFGRKAELVERFGRGVKQALDRFARGEWFTPEMATAWEAHSRHREAAQESALIELADALGVDYEQLQTLGSRFWILPRMEGGERS